MTNSNQPWQLLEGDCLKVLATLPAESVQTCITSPPYWGLRDYGSEGQLGLEAMPEAYVANMVAVFREVRRVLRYDGTLWLNLGDSYTSGGRKDRDSSLVSKTSGVTNRSAGINRAQTPDGLKPKDLVGIPWRVAFALQADGWYLRQDIIWHKPNPMPESTTDRCTKAHEYIFLMTKSAHYFYDAEAVKERTRKIGGPARIFGAKLQTGTMRQDIGRDFVDTGTRNKRSVWTVTTKPFKGAHFATFPPDLIEPCVLAGSADKCCPKCGRAWERITERLREHGVAEAGFPKTECIADNQNAHKRLHRRLKAARDAGEPHDNALGGIRTVGFRPACDCGETDSIPSTVLDPFNGAGTTGVVAIQHGRRYIGIDLNTDYLEMARKRIQETRDGITLPLGL